MPTNNPYADARQKKGRPLFIPFAVLGDPDPQRSRDVVRTMIEHGADALELGFPFSDPPADGPVIQKADARALQAGVRVDDCFALLRDIRRMATLPVGLLIYYNLVLQRGVDRFYRDCAEAGVTSVLIADLPLEHADEILPAAQRHGVAPVFMVSELTSPERFDEIAAVAGGYLYVVSYLGVTGVEHAVLQDKIADVVRSARQHTSLPLCVGFGINSAEQARAAVQAGADGVIVGSRIVREVPDLASIAAVCDELRAAIG
ncbi:MAG: tryptophan synthase subunit alpha [Thermoguttaceae bacterium]